jgi:hypothetical protein
MRLVPLFASVLLAGWVALAVTAGCAQMAWEKPGAGYAAVSSDLEECRREASLQSFRLGLQAPAPNVVIDPQSPAASVQIPSALPTRDSVVEQQFTMSCMRGKGYELVRLR